MLASCLCDIQRDTLEQFDLTIVTFLTKLHLSDFDCKKNFFILLKKKILFFCFLSESNVTMSSIMG
jgi:hypothetical protein